MLIIPQVPKITTFNFFKSSVGFHYHLHVIGEQTNAHTLNDESVA